MKMVAVNEAIAEAQRFIKAAKQVKAVKFFNGVPAAEAEYGKDSAACKRASMDLTRALAKMRRP
jgi:hypothetical protein